MRSAAPPVCDQPPANTLPTILGAVRRRDNQIEIVHEVLAADVVDGRSLQASVTLNGDPLEAIV